MSEPTGVLGDGWWPVARVAREDAPWAGEPRRRHPADADSVTADAHNGAADLAAENSRRRDPPAWRLLAGDVARLLARLMPALAAGSRPGALLSPRRLVRGLSRRTRARALRRFGQLPFFDAADYLALNRDVAGSRVAADFHALFLGGAECRVLFRPDAVARSLGACLPATSAAPAAAARPAAERGRCPRLGLFVSSLGNVFMREIADDLAASLRTAGIAVEVLDETADIAARPAMCVFVAPHEFFLLGRGPQWVRDEVVSRAFMLNTEQVQTPWFVRALPFLLASRGVIDLCAQTTAIFAQTGLPSLHVGLTPPDGAGRLSAGDRCHPLFRVLPAAARVDPRADCPFEARPIEIAFFGAETPQRSAWLARNAGFLADYETFIHCRRIDRGPLRTGTSDGALTRLARHVCGHARISLNLHRDAFGYLEWHRVVRLGLASGSVVVSEPCLPHPLLHPGVHYFEEQSRQIPDLLEWLLRSADGRRRAAAMQHAAAKLLADGLDPRQTAARVLAFVLDPGLAPA
jgi:hypothetical protein